MTNYQIAFDVICHSLHVSKKSIVSSSRLGPLVEARNMFILLLSEDGERDEPLAWLLNRSRSMIYIARKTAYRHLEGSKVFRDKYSKIKVAYEKRKSLRESAY